MTRAHEAGEGRGWIEFVGLFYVIAGAFNLIAGVAALSRKEFFNEHAALFQHMAFWGWVWLAVAVAHFAIGAFILRRSASARMWGIAFALVGLVVWFVGFGAYPLWSLIMMVLYGLILYGLTAYREYFR